MVRGMGYHTPPPTSQAGEVTDSDGGGRVRAGGKVVPCPHATWIWRGQTNILGLERKGTLQIYYEAFKQ
jgi:hypothetical protein